MRTKRKERPRFSFSPLGLTPAHSSTTRASVQDCLFALTRERHLARLEAAWQQPRLAIAAHRNAGSFNAACPREASCPEHSMGGRNLTVNEARPKPERSGGFGGGGGNRRRSEPRW